MRRYDNYIMQRCENEYVAFVRTTVAPCGSREVRDFHLTQDLRR